VKKRKFTWKPGYKYLIVLGIFLCLCLVNSSYSFYKETKENKNALYLEGVNLVYTITSPSLSDNRIVVSGNSSTTVPLQITSTNAKDTEYELYYQIVESLSIDEVNKVTVECIDSKTQDLPTGSISTNGMKTVVIEIKNNNDASVTIEFGVQGGLSGKELVLEQGDSVPVVSSIELVDAFKSEAVLDNIASTYVTSSTGINFHQISSDTNGKGLYILHGTENDKYPIMYYRGAVKNNNVKFANFCWKIVRTTETGGIKLIYNGDPDENGQCTATGTDTLIGKTGFNSSGDNAYLGYMYGTPNSSSYTETHKNVYDSKIKIIIDEWYGNYLNKYTDEIEDTVWCNDRSIVSSSLGNGTGVSETYYGASSRLYTITGIITTPSLECINANDRFAVSEENGNGALTYPIALLTADEMIYAGARYGKENNSYYLNNGDSYWSLSLYGFGGNVARMFYADASESLTVWYLYATNGVRPAISLKSGTNAIILSTIIYRY